MAKLKKIQVDLNIAPLMIPVAHGRRGKDMVVLHETVSPDYAGLKDVLSVAHYMPKNGLGIHGIVDAEGYLAWDVLGEAHVLYHADSRGPDGVSHGVNTRSIGIEQISNVMIKFPDNVRRWEWWWQRDRQIDKVAQVLAYLHRVARIPLVYSDGREPGVTTHWEVSQTYNVPGGHTDCWPKHRGGYYPALRVIGRARYFAKKGY